MENNPLNGTFVDFIDQDTITWNVNLVRRLYQPHDAEEILHLPLSRIFNLEDKLIWKYSNLGDYKVKKAYQMLLQNYYPVHSQDHRSFGISNNVWRRIWKVKLPLKILTFIRKLLYDSLPVFEWLVNKGITVSSKCRMCNDEEKSINHLFLKCHSARAIWHGSNLEIRTLDSFHLSIKQWVEVVCCRMTKGKMTKWAYCNPCLQPFGPYRTIEIWFFIKDKCQILWRLF